MIIFVVTISEIDNKVNYIFKKYDRQNLVVYFEWSYTFIDAMNIFGNGNNDGYAKNILALLSVLPFFYNCGTVILKMDNHLLGFDK